MPRSYSVPVTLSGSVAEEMKQTLADMDLEEPRYNEILDRKKRFQLMLANEGYSAQTRDLLSGILNPIEMIDVVLTSIVRYREKELLNTMLRETNFEKKLTEKNGMPVWALIFTPKGKRFSYRYQDMGAYVEEVWLTKLILAVDTATMKAQQLLVKKHSRMFRADDDKQPVAVAKKYRYEFAYEEIGKATLPSKLSLHVNDSLTLTIGAAYKKLKNFVVFNNRNICYHFPGRLPSCLTMSYGNYDLQASPHVLKTTPAASGKHAKKIKQAAELARKASIALKNGKIDIAVRTMRAIAQSYRGTPQAVEAQKLLEGLPEGL